MERHCVSAITLSTVFLTAFASRVVDDGSGEAHFGGNLDGGRPRTKTEAEVAAMENTTHSSFDIGAQEFITAVMQDTFSDSGLGNALVFYTSASRIISLQGTDARRRHRFVAPLDGQIVGL